MVKFETHLHTGGASFCAHVPHEQIIEELKANGYGGVFVTNHYMKSVMDTFADDFKAQLEIYLQAYEKLKKLGAAAGIKVLLSMELNPEPHNIPGHKYPVESGKVHPVHEFLIHGIDADLLRKNPCLYQLTQAELFEFCNAHDLLMYQSHPFRDWTVCADGKYMHGVEVYNGHPHHDSHNDRALAFADQYSLKMIAGSDYHDLGGLSSGIFLPEEIDSEREFVEYAKTHALQLAVPADVQQAVQRVRDRHHGKIL